MSRLVHHRDMSAAEILGCAYDALGLVTLCGIVASEFPSPTSRSADVVARALDLAGELLAPVIDALEAQEGTRSQEK